MRNEREIEMTFEEAVKMATERWLPAGATPEKIAIIWRKAAMLEGKEDNVKVVEYES